MNVYALQQISTGKFIYSESHFSHTNNFDNALLFKEAVIKDKLQQYPGYKKVPYVSLGNVVSRY